MHSNILKFSEYQRRPRNNFGFSGFQEMLLRSHQLSRDMISCRCSRLQTVKKKTGNSSQEHSRIPKSRDGPKPPNYASKWNACLAGVNPALHAVELLVFVGQSVEQPLLVRCRLRAVCSKLAADVAKFATVVARFAKFWRAHSRLYQSRFIQGCSSRCSRKE